MKTSFTTALALLFIGLKLAHVVTWSWWWVLSPLWLPIAVWLFVAAVLILLLTIVELLQKP